MHVHTCTHTHMHAHVLTHMHTHTRTHTHTHAHTHTHLQIYDCTVREVDPSTILIGATDETVQYSFCMCNPPFFKDNEDRYGGGGVPRSKPRPLPTTFSRGTVEEMITEEGEVEFVKRIVHDSLILRSRVG